MKKHKLIKKLKALGLPPDAIDYILRIITAPSRKGTGYFGSVYDTYASEKNGFTVNSESRHFEAPFILSCEFDPAVLLYADQPEPVKISYKKKNGRRME